MMVARGERVGGLGEKSEEIKNYNCQSQNSLRDINNIGNIVNNIIVTMYSAKWVLEILGEQLCKVYD